LAELLGWMNANGLALFAAHWMHNLPLTFDLPAPVQFRMAESFARLGDWKRLDTLIAAADWGNLEFLRDALLARCLEASGDFVNARSRWNTATEAVPSGGKELETLVAVAAQWGWEKDLTAGLWTLSEKSDHPVRALTLLYTLYLEDHDTEGLYRVLSKIVELTPNNDSANNNLALISLLLNKDKARALAIARTLYSRTPENPAYASTYAFALYCDGKAAQGLDVINKLTPQQKEEPSVAAYCSVLLAANGHFKEVEPFLQLAQQAPLLPEEERLLHSLDLAGDKP
jgi:Flp pilus assembly protein TadD